MKPWIHAKSSAKRFSGKPEDYICIHQFMDSSKSAFSSNAHRAATHNSFFIGPDGPLERAFGKVIINSDGKEVSVRDIGEQHCQEDFNGVIPTLQDWLENLEIKPWMNGIRGLGAPPSCRKIAEKQTTKTISINTSDIKEIIEKKDKTYVD